jgi:ParB-like chromosome segregation protein Spo0J
VSGYACQRLELARLRPTELVDEGEVARLANAMRQDGAQRRPVLVERVSLAILDGHHRFRAAQALGLSRINAVVIDYDDPRLTLASWTGRDFTREEVRAAARDGVLLPPKSTRHILNPPLQEMPVALSMLA